MGKENQEITGNVDVGNKPFRWCRGLNSYLNKNLRALKFKSVKEIDRAIDLCWLDPELFGLPREYADGKTMIVPEEAISIFKDRGLKFKASELES